MRVVTNYFYKGSKRKPGWRAIRRHVLDHEQHVCYLCGGRADEVDHVIPRYWGGTEAIGNIRACCGPCNKRKGNTLNLRTVDGIDRRNALVAVRERFDVVLGDLRTVLWAIYASRDDLDYPAVIMEGRAPSGAERPPAMPDMKDLMDIFECAMGISVCTECSS